MAPNAVAAVARYQDLRRAVPQYFLTTLNPENGRQTSQIELPGGLMIDRDGRILVTLLDGRLASFGN